MKEQKGFHNAAHSLRDVHKSIVFESIDVTYELRATIDRPPIHHLPQCACFPKYLVSGWTRGWVYRRLDCDTE